VKTKIQPEHIVIDMIRWEWDRGVKPRAFTDQDVIVVFENDKQTDSFSMDQVPSQPDVFTSLSRPIRADQIDVRMPGDICVVGRIAGPHTQGRQRFYSNGHQRGFVSEKPDFL
jgi:hypothetical protein